MMKVQNRYSVIIENIFRSKFKSRMRQIEFKREEIVGAAKKLKIDLPKNLGDLVYSFRYRADLPKTIRKRAPKGKIWIIRPAGRALYRFVLVADRPLLPNVNMAATKVPDSTPGVIVKYAFNDEQSLLAKVRYNRLVDILRELLATHYKIISGLRCRMSGRSRRTNFTSGWTGKESTTFSPSRRRGELIS